MKTSLRLSRIVSVVAAVSMGAAALAQPPVPGGPASPPPGPGRPGSGYPLPLGQIVLPPPEPPPLHHRRSRVSSYAGDSTVVAVQRALKKRGYYAGPVDGDAGSGTRAAIRGFRRDRGLGSSSRIDGALLRALGL